MSDLTVEVVTDPEGLQALFGIWDDLFAATTGASPYLSRGWVEPWWEHFGKKSLVGPALWVRPHVITVRRRGEVVALLPWLSISTAGFPARILVGIGQETADYGGGLFRDESAEVFGVLLDHLEVELGRGRTLIDVARLMPGSALLEAIEARFATSAKYRLHAEQLDDYPYVRLPGEPHTEAFIAGLERANDVRRRSRRLSEKHKIVFHYHRPDHVAQDLRTFFELHDQRWRALHDESSGLFATPRGRAFLHDAAAGLNASDLLRVSHIEADGVPIAARFGTVNGRTYFGMKSGWDPNFANYGPGHLMVAQVLRSLTADGRNEFDLLRGPGAHKQAWANGTRTVPYWMLGRRDRFAPFDRRWLWAVLSLRVRARR